MGQFIDFLLSNPLILIILGGWLLSSLGSLGAKAARKAAQEQKRQAQQAREQGRRQQPTAAQSRPQAPAATRREAPKPEDIAAEIRRMMGLEESPPMTRPEPVTVSSEPPVVAPPRPRKPKPPAAPIFIDEADLVPAARRRSAAGGATRSAVAKPARLGSFTEGRRRPGRMLDLRYPAAVFVAMEVLGPPRSLRGFDHL